MKKLVLYSDHINNANENIDKELYRLITTAKPKLGYIPSCSDINYKYYNKAIEYYKKIGISDFMYFDVDKEYDEDKLKDLLECNIIHLSGGDTSYFMKNIKCRNLENVLINYVNSGGILVGVSAGAIIITQNISIVRFFDEECNDIQKGLGLVNFEFIPHWNKYKDKLEEIMEYSKSEKKIIYLCEDIGGIIINDKDITAYGNIIKIDKGFICKKNYDK